jgi:DNA invertase Pin-like site-specific DNA recombinase
MEIMYVRVSSEDQNLDVQLEHAKKLGVDRTYQEKRSGKSTQDRPEFLKMMDAVRPGDTVIVYSIDRFGRNLIDILTNVRDLNQRGVKFKSILEPQIDTTTEFGELVLSIWGAFAEYLRKYNARKSREGIELARAQGKHLGRRAKTSEKEQARIVVLWKGGASLSEIADEFKISPRSVSRVLERKGIKS